LFFNRYPFNRLEQPPRPPPPRGFRYPLTGIYNYPPPCPTCRAFHEAPEECRSSVFLFFFFHNSGVPVYRFRPRAIIPCAPACPGLAWAFPWPREPAWPGSKRFGSPRPLWSRLPPRNAPHLGAPAAAFLRLVRSPPAGAPLGRPFCSTGSEFSETGGGFFSGVGVLLAGSAGDWLPLSAAGPAGPGAGGVREKVRSASFRTGMAGRPLCDGPTGPALRGLSFPHRPHPCRFAAARPQKLRARQTPAFYFGPARPQIPAPRFRGPPIVVAGQKQIPGPPRRLSPRFRHLTKLSNQFRPD